MMVDKRLLEAIDACRPGSDDLADADLNHAAEQIEQEPEAAALYRQVQAFDAKVASAMDDVPVPGELPERLLSALRKAKNHEGNAVAERPAPASTVRFASRRRLILSVAGSLAAALLVAGLVWLLRPGAGAVALAESDLRTLAAGTWLEQLRKLDPQDWKSPASVTPISPQLRVEPIEQTSLTFSLPGEDREFRAQAFKLLSHGRVAYLFVVDTESQPLDSSALRLDPRRQPHNTQGLSIEAWKEGPTVYVVAVPGEVEDYFRFIKAEQSQIS